MPAASCGLPLPRRRLDRSNLPDYNFFAADPCHQRSISSALVIQIFCLVIVMELDRFSEFALIAKYKSIKKAAQELDISCATLSARLLRFEDQIGTPLFIRTSSGMELTDCGRQLLPSAADILSLRRQLRQNMQAAQIYAYQRLRIAVSGSNLPMFLGPFLDRLNQTYPSINLELMDDRRFGIVDGIRSGEVDIYFAPVMEDFDPQGLSKKEIAAASQYVVMPRSHPLAERSALSIADLDGEQFLLYPQTAEPAIREFQLKNLSASSIRYTLYESGTAPLFYKLLVPIGKGILLQPYSMMDIPPNAVCIPLSPLPHPAVNCFFYDERNPSENVRAFVTDFPLFAKEALSSEHGPSL